MGMILGMEPKNIVILTTCCRVTAIYIFQYIVIYFSKSWAHWFTSLYIKNKKFRGGFAMDYVWLWFSPPKPQKNFRENHFSET